MRQLATLVLRSENVGRLVGDKAHHHDDRENMKWFVLQLTRLDERANYYVHDTTTDPHEPHQIVTFEIVGRISWEQTELRFDVVDIDGRAHGIAQIPWLGMDAVWVATPKDDGSDDVRISWRTTRPSDE